MSGPGGGVPDDDDASLLENAVWLDEVDSTNAEAARRAAAGQRGPLWIVAKRQTAGRGRAGRRWSMPEGNLAATYLCHPAVSPAQAALYSFVAATAVGYAVRRLCPGGDVRFKWPNDVLLNGGKVAGILLESGGARPDRVDWLAIGIGLNLVAAPDETDIREGGRRATSVVAEGGARQDLEEVLFDIDTNLTCYSRALVEDGFELVRQLWRARAHGRGGPVSVDTGQARVSGIFSDVDDQGRLVIDTGEGLHRVAAGDVHFPD